MMRAAAGAAGDGEVDLTELYFLVSDFLARATPCQRAAQALREELTEHGLLGPAYDWQGQTHSATPQEVALRYRRLPSDQLPRLLGAALRAGATEEEGNGPSQAQAQAQAQQCVGHGRGATIRAYGSSDVRVPSILSAVRGDERSNEEVVRVRRHLARALSNLAQASSQLRRVKAAIARAKAEALSAEWEARMARELETLLEASRESPKPPSLLPPSPTTGAAAAAAAAGAAEERSPASPETAPVVAAAMAVDASQEGEEVELKMEAEGGGAEADAKILPEQPPPAEREGAAAVEQGQQEQELAQQQQREGAATVSDGPAPPAPPAGGQAGLEEEEEELQQLEMMDAFAAAPAAAAAPQTEEDDAMVVEVVLDDERDVGAASRARVERELEERVSLLRGEVARLLHKARRLRALRTQATHEGCRTLPDVVLRRQTLPDPRALPRRVRPPTYLYGRLRHLKTVNGHFSCPVYCIKYDRRGQYVVTGSDDQLVKLWSARTGWLMRSLRGHAGVITDLSLSSDNSLLATASEDGTVCIWAAVDGAPLALLRGHTDTINYVHFHPFYNLLITGSDDGSARAWDLGPLKETTRELPAGQQAAIAPMLPPDASAALPAPTVLEHLAAAAGNANAAAAGEEGDGQAAPRAKVKCISVSPLGTHIATGGDDGVGRIWSIEALEWAGERGAELEEAAEAFRAAAALGATEGQRLTARQRAAATGGGAGGAAAAAATAAVAALQEGAVPPSPPGQLVARLLGHRSTVTDINYSHAGDRLFTGSMADNAARVWTWGPGYASPTCVLLDATAVGAGDAELAGGAAAAASAAAGEQQQQQGKKRKSEPQEETNNAVWTCDDRRIVTLHATPPGPQAQQEGAGGGAEDGEGGGAGGNWKQNVKVWDPETGALLQVLRGHRRQCSVLVAHPTEGRVVLSAGYDGRVCLWDIERGGQPLLSFLNVQEWGPVGAEYNLGDPVALVDGQFAPDGSTFTVTDGAGRLLLFGSADKGALDAVFPEQYFVGDYDQLQWDTHGNVIDTMHQLAPHLLGRRALTNAERVAYPEQPSYDLTGPRPLTREEALAMIREAREKARAVEQVQEARAAAAARALARMPSRTLAGAVGDRGRVHTLQHGEGRRRRREDDEFDYDWRSDAGGSESEAEGGGAGRGLSRAERYQRRRLGQVPAYHEEGEGGESVVHAPRLRRRRRRQQDNMRARAERRRRRHREDGWGEEDGSDSEHSGGGGRRLRGSESEGDGMEEDSDDSRPGRRRGRPRSRAAASAAAAAAEEPVVEGPGDAYGPIDPRAQGLPVELDEFDTSIVATTLVALPAAPAAAAAVAASGGEGGEGGAAASAAAAAAVAATAPPGPAAASSSAAAPGVTEVDRRTLACAMCKKGHSEDFALPGPVLGSHPLKLRDRPVWVHDECARWSPQTFIGQEDERWYNIAVEVRRGRQTRCFHCKQSGATIGCHCPSCARSYHYPCAVLSGFTFTPEEFFRCPLHRNAAGGGRGARRARTAGGAGRRGGRQPKRRRVAADEEEGEEGEEEDGAPEAMVLGGAVLGGHWYPSVGMQLARDWLRATAPEHDVTGVLVPQKGDSVVYFPRAHFEASRAFEAAAAAHCKRGGDRKEPAAGAEAGAEPWGVFSLSWTGVRCRVESVEYLFPADDAAYAACPSVVARVTLAPNGALVYQEDAEEVEIDESVLPEGKWTFDKIYGPDWRGFTFQVDVRKPLPPSVDGGPPTPFLALESCFLAAISHPWQPGARVKAAVAEAGRGGRAARRAGLMYGTVKAVAQRWLPLYWHPVDEANAAPTEVQGWGPYRYLDVEWDASSDGGGGSGGAAPPKPSEVNVWEVLPAHAPETLPFWDAPSLAAEEAAGAAAALRPLAEEEQYLPFVVPVDCEEFASYPLIVPLPMEYMLILDRLEAGTYYRTLAAVEADVRLVALNCGLFNEEGALITACAKQMMTAAVAALRKVRSGAGGGGGGGGGGGSQQRAATEAGVRRSGRESKYRALDDSAALSAAAAAAASERPKRGAASRFAVKQQDEEDVVLEEEEDDSVAYAGGGEGKRKRGGGGAVGMPMGENGFHHQQYHDEELQPRGSERIATSRAIAASLAEAAGANGGGRSSRRSARAASSSSSSAAAGESAYASSPPQQQQQQARARRLKIVQSSDSSATPSPSARGGADGDGDGGDSATRRSARRNKLRIRLRPLTEGELEEEEAEEDGGQGEEAEEEEEEERPPPPATNGLDAIGGSAGPDERALGRGMRRSRLRKGEAACPEPLPAQRTGAIEGLLDRLVEADDYQVLSAAESEAAAASVAAAANAASAAGGRQGAARPHSATSLTVAGIRSRAHAGGYKSMQEAEWDVRALLETLADSRETINRSEAQRLLGALPRLLQGACAEAMAE